MGQEESTPIDDSVAPETLTARTLAAVADHIKGGKAKKVVVLTGAGISTAAGIPDFRSPKTGLYNNLARLNLPYAEAVFDISYFRQHPEPFYVLAKELYPGKFFPTISHAFIALLAKKGFLHMLFTQNIDCLERRAGVPADRIVEAHGSFATQRCIECSKEFPDDRMKEHVFKGEVPRCVDKRCDGLVKPDIVFFGESLPRAFGENADMAATADLVLVIGTSLTVFPFAKLPELASSGRPRVLFNMERVGQMGNRADDVLQLGPCDMGIRKLAEELGWAEELESLWRGVVGHEEAERQLRTKQEQIDEVENEVDKLAEEIDAALNFEQPDVGGGSVDRPTHSSERDADDQVAEQPRPNSAGIEGEPSEAGGGRDGVPQEQGKVKPKNNDQPPTTTGNENASNRDTNQAALDRTSHGEAESNKEAGSSTTKPDTPRTEPPAN